MKLICDCGYEEVFNTIDEETKKERECTEEEGQYATIEGFNFWEQHDVVGFVCKNCGKAIWMFV